VIGVQSDGYPLWVRTFQEGAPPAVTPRTVADGTAAPYDPSMLECLRECVDTWLAVPEPSLREAIPRLAADAKVVAEGAGALAYAALDLLPQGAPTVAVISGGNIAQDLLADLLDELR
jgi:threonine dehydratase